MGIFNIVSGILLIIASIFIIVVNLLQETKQQGMTSAIGGGSSDSFYGKNSSRTREAKLVKVTRFMAFLFFGLTLAVNLVPVFLKK
mgnify:CR=1 FL=1